MQEHAIPQDVTGYKFHIVGNMTLGQFAQLVAGAIICFVIYSTNLFAVVKWTLILIVAAITAMAAFIPIAERPLSHWITTFLGTLFKPTRFAWRRVPKIPEPLLYQPLKSTEPILPELDLTPARRLRIQEFLSTTHQISGPDAETRQVDAYYQHVFSLFSSDQTVQRGATVVVEKPQLKVRMRSLRSNPSTPVAIETALSTTAETPSTDAISDESHSASQQLYVSDKSLDISAYQSQQDKAASRLSQRPSTTISADSVPIPEESIPVVEQAVENSAPSADTAGTTSPAITNTLSAPQLSPLPPPSQATNTAPAAAATFNKQLPFPTKPTTPNKLVGMILTAQNDLVEGAIIEIRSADGQVARAVRSNALGQFYVTTPLANGSYVLAAEKQGFRFEPVAITLKGKIVDPIEIRSV